MSSAHDTLSPPGFATEPAPAEPVPLRQRGWFRLTLLAAMSTILIVTAMVGLIAATPQDRVNDPRSYQIYGASAASNLIADQGVDVTASYDVAKATQLLQADSTFVVANPDLVSAEQWRAILARAPADLVVLSSENSAVEALSSPVTVSTALEISQELDPGCTDPDALRAGSMTIALFEPTLALKTAPRYVSTSEAVTTCYADPTSSAGGAGYARYTQGATEVHLFAGGLQNAHLDLDGNASFSMALLGRHRQLVWLTAQQENPGAASGQMGPDGKPILVLPKGWGWAATMGVFTLIVVAVWRGRRLGPILEENLPVRVRASETVEGHGRLYFRNDARPRAAEILRSATLTRLRAQFGQSDPQALVSLITDRVGAPEDQITNLLFGAPPGTDAELIGLQDSLQHLETEVRRL